ncbi:MAG: hypothetical protein LBT46_02805 [Planctomycetaceae bacterium]|nr:hypothetical protein [Planctomycetaceae bacterium]
MSPDNLQQALTAVKSYVDTGIAGAAFSVIIVTTLPATGESGILYLVGSAAPYDSFVWNGTAFVAIGGEAAMTETEVADILETTGFVEGE